MRYADHTSGKPPKIIHFQFFSPDENGKQKKNCEREKREKYWLSGGIGIIIIAEDTKGS